MLEITRTISTFALVFGFPAEGSLDSVISFLQKFGEVKSVDLQQWVGHSIKTDTLRVRIIRRSTHIPRFLSIDGIRCKVWYREQPLRCDICSGPHKVASCPMRGKCMKCHKEGHVRRDCPVAGVLPLLPHRWTRRILWTPPWLRLLLTI